MENLPSELLIEIFKYIDTPISLILVNKEFHRLYTKKKEEISLSSSSNSKNIKIQNTEDNNFNHQTTGDNTYIRKNSLDNNSIRQNSVDNKSVHQNSVDNNPICQNVDNNLIAKDDIDDKDDKDTSSSIEEEVNDDYFINSKKDDDNNDRSHNNSQLNNMDSDKKIWFHELKKEYNLIFDAANDFTDLYKENIIMIHGRIIKTKVI
nr:7521_t:CDS:2 [Entrophospora candida]